SRSAPSRWRRSKTSSPFPSEREWRPTAIRVRSRRPASSLGSRKSSPSGNDSSPYTSVDPAEGLRQSVSAPNIISHEETIDWPQSEPLTRRLSRSAEDHCLRASRPASIVHRRGEGARDVDLRDQQNRGKARAADGDPAPRAKHAARRPDRSGQGAL